MPVSVRIAAVEDMKRVERFVMNSKWANLYHDCRWGAVIEKCFRHKYRLLISESSGGAISGILPLVHMRSWGFGNFIVSMPYFNYGGVCADDEQSKCLLVEEAIRLAKELAAKHIEFRQETSLNHGFKEKTLKVSMRLAFPPTSDDLWKSFPSKLRSQIRVPQKGGLQSRIGRLEELDGFYDVFSRNMRHLGTPVYPKRFFREILEAFPDSTWICSVYLGSAVVASGFLAGFKGMLEIPWASSLRSSNRLSPNMLLYWECLRFGCDNGYASFDFGRSTRGESTYKFKEQWGAKESPMVWSYWTEGGGNLPDISPRNRKYQLAIALWKRLPVPVTKVIGPRIVRNIP
jgi:serine/alanine adding enzyme